MKTSPKLAKKDNGTRPKMPRLVEVVGPAGAGKTTLCQELDLYRDEVLLDNFPDVRKLARVPFFIWNGLRLLPSLLLIPKNGSRSLTRREFAWLCILYGWPELLRKELRKNNKIVILDQGPVYLLTELNQFGPEFLRDKAALKMWQSLCSRWAALLDRIVWLDASDEDLLARIRLRDKDHVVKGESAQRVIEFLGCYRKAYERTFSMLAGNCHGPQIYKFDTQRESPDEIANRLLIKLGVQGIAPITDLGLELDT